MGQYIEWGQNIERSVDDPEVLLLYISDKFLLQINKKFPFLPTTKKT